MAFAQRIAVTGASGLIGSALVGYLKSEGHTVQRLVRRATVAPDEIRWDPKTGYVDIEALRGVDAVIHLAGVGVSDKRWTKRFKSEILNSRLLGTTTIAIRSMVYLGLSYDHRVVDGADAARFLVTLKERLEGGAFESDLGL